MSVMASGSSAFLGNSDLYELNLRFKPQTGKNLLFLNLLLVTKLYNFFWCSSLKECFLFQSHVTLGDALVVALDKTSCLQNPSLLLRDVTVVRQE